MENLKIELPDDPATPPPGIYPKKTKHKLRKTCAPSMFIATLFTIVKIWRQPKGPLMDEWLRENMR